MADNCYQRIKISVSAVRYKRPRWLSWCPRWLIIRLRLDRPDDLYGGEMGWTGMESGNWGGGDVFERRRSLGDVEELVNGEAK